MRKLLLPVNLLSLSFIIALFKNLFKLLIKNTEWKYTNFEKLFKIFWELTT